MGLPRCVRSVRDLIRHPVVGPGLAASVVAISFACSGTSPSPPPQPTPEVAQEPGIAWASFIRDDCEWSAPGQAASCFGHRGPGFRVRAVRREGERWYIWDPSTSNYAYVSRNALSLPAELTADDDPDATAAKAVVSCVDRSQGYRFTAQARDAIASWIQSSAHPGDVFYERWIEDNSYRPEAEIVPAIRVPAEPTRLPAPAATPGPPNPFNRDEVAHATATVSAIQTVEARASATRESIDASTRAALNQQVGALRTAPADPALDADVSGCARKAAELLQGFDGDRYLVVAGNLEDGAPQLPEVKFDRARIRLVYAQCDDPARCDDVKQAWLQVAAATDAADITFADPSEGLTRIESP